MTSKNQSDNNKNSESYLISNSTAKQTVDSNNNNNYSSLEYDCKKPQDVEMPDRPESDDIIKIDYMAKDYASFRNALLELVPVRHPEWSDLTKADTGIMLVDLLSFVADELSYYQDRVANEAFLRWANRRSSVERHLRLIGYNMHNGLSANAFVMVTAKAAGIIPSNFQLYSAASSSTLEKEDKKNNGIIFEVTDDRFVDPHYNKIPLVSIDNNKNSAKLAGSFTKFKKGHWVILEQGRKRDLIRLADDPKIRGMITEITWSSREPLKFSYGNSAANAYVYGNILQVNHGKTVDKEILKERIIKRRSEFSFTLKEAPLTYVSEDRDDSHYYSSTRSATSPSGSSSPTLNAKTTLSVWVDHELWHETDTLLECSPYDQNYVVTLDDEGYATLTFGDNIHGKKPLDDSLILSTYRVGSGAAGNIGENVLTHYDTKRREAQLIQSITNPLPATGGINIQSAQEAKVIGPKSLNYEERAVTLNDYEELIRQKFEGIVSNVKAKSVLTGSWTTIMVSIDVKGDNLPSPSFLENVRQYLQNVKIAGNEIHVQAPKYVPVEIGLTIFVQRGINLLHIQERVKASLGNKENPDGSKGFFHFDNFTFGKPVYLSKLYETIRSISEVKDISLKVFKRRTSSKSSLLTNKRIERDESTNRNLKMGYIHCDEDEILVLDNVITAVNNVIVSVHDTMLTKDNDPTLSTTGILALNFVEVP